MFLDLLGQLSVSEATEEGLEKELRERILPDLEPMTDPPGVEGGVTKLNCSGRPWLKILLALSTLLGYTTAL